MQKKQQGQPEDLDPGERPKKKQKIINKTEILDPIKLESKDPRKGKILKVRAKGDNYFDRIILMQGTMNKLIKKIQEKRQDFRPIALVIHLPDVRIRDNQDVGCLSDNDELEVLFAESNNNSIPTPSPTVNMDMIAPTVSVDTITAATHVKEHGKISEDPGPTNQNNRHVDLKSTLEQKGKPEPAIHYYLS